MAGKLGKQYLANWKESIRKKIRKEMREEKFRKKIICQCQSDWSLLKGAMS